MSIFNNPNYLSPDGAYATLEAEIREWVRNERKYGHEPRFHGFLDDYPDYANKPWSEALAEKLFNEVVSEHAEA